MSLLDDARRLANDEPLSYGDCIYCDAQIAGRNNAQHTPDCPWPSLPELVAALEMVGPMMKLMDRMGQHHRTYREMPMGPYAPPGSPPTYKTCEHYCASWPCVEHEAYEAVSAFADAVLGEVVPEDSHVDKE